MPLLTLGLIEGILKGIYTRLFESGLKVMASVIHNNDCIPGAIMGKHASINTFLICFIIMLGFWFVYHGMITHNDYNLNFHGIGKFPVPEGYSSLGQDFAYPYNGASNFMDPQHGVFQNQGCYLPSSSHSQCGHFTPLPFNAVFFAAFTYFDFETAYRVFLLCLFILWGFFCYVASKEVVFSPAHLALLMAVILLSCPFHFEYERGNWHSLAFLPIIFAFYSVHWKNDIITAAFLLALALFLKLHPGLIIAYFLLKGQFRLCVWAGLFSIVFFVMSGGFEIYNNYRYQLSHYSVIMAGGGWGNHSTTTMVETLFGYADNGAMKLKIANIISSIMLLITFGYFFIMSKRSNALILKIELCMVLILANIIPSAAMRYSVVYIPFIMLTLAEAFDHEAVRNKLAVLWRPALIVVAIIASYTLMSPIGSGNNRFNVIWSWWSYETIMTIRNLWWWLMVLFVALFYFHWVLSRSESSQVRENPLKRWFNVDIGPMLTGLKHLSTAFSAARFFDWMDPVEGRLTKPVLLMRSVVLVLLVYLTYVSAVGSMSV